MAFLIRMNWKIGVCIPCAPKDRGFLRFCLLSVQAQTRAPDFVAVSLSNIVDPQKLTLDLSGITMPVTFVYSPKTLLAGANRNLAAAAAVAPDVSCNLLSFFDADDLMHPRRLELLEKYFTDHPETGGILHHFMVGDKRKMGVYTGEIPVPWPDIVDNDFQKNPFCLGERDNLYHVKFVGAARKGIRGYGQGANGHLTMRADLWATYKYIETTGRGEDGHMTGTILKHKWPVGYTGNALSLYQRGDRAGFTLGL